MVGCVELGLLPDVTLAGGILLPVPVPPDTGDELGGTTTGGRPPVDPTPGDDIGVELDEIGVEPDEIGAELDEIGVELETLGGSRPGDELGGDGADEVGDDKLVSDAPPPVALVAVLGVVCGDPRLVWVLEL